MVNTNLLKYNNPFVVSNETSKSDFSLDSLETTKADKTERVENAIGVKNAIRNTKPQDVLNSMFPPKKWIKDNQMWMKMVSSTPATRSEVSRLAEDLDLALKDRKANAFGICNIREEIYSECFDELIRQVTLSCAERGLLLHRIRDEMRMTKEAYHHLYESSVTFGIRKALLARQEKERLQKNLQESTEEVNDLKEQIQKLSKQLEVIEDKHEKERKMENEKNESEIKRLRKRANQIKEALERFLVEGQNDLANVVISNFNSKEMYE